MNTEFCLRAATPTDARQLGTVGPAIYAEAYSHVWNHADAYAEHLENFSDRAFAEFLARPNTRTWLVECNRHIVGFLLLERNVPDPVEGRTDGAKVARIYLLAPARGEGLAGKLMAEADRYARSEGLDHLWLDALKNATQAPQTYKRWGFTTIGETIFPGNIKPEFKTMVVMRRPCVGNRG